MKIITTKKPVIQRTGLAMLLIAGYLQSNVISAQLISMGANGSGGTSMAVCSKGNVQMWGDNGLGQEGTNCASSSGNGYTLVLNGADAGCVNYLCNIIGVANGSDYNGYAVDNSGNVWGWGYNNFCNLAQGVDGCDPGSCGGGCNAPSPVEILTAPATPLTGIIKIAAGFNTAFGIDGSGHLWGWGYNNFCEVGNNVCGTDVTYATEVHGVGNAGLLSGVTACAAGYANTLAVANGAVYGWGLNNCGQDGQGYPSNASVPVEVETNTVGPVYLTHCLAVAEGQYNSYALDSNGHVWTWGLDNLGQGGVNLANNAPGDGGGSSNNTAVEVGSGGCGGGILTHIAAIAAGWTNAYALDSSGHIWAWGYNADGECGDGTTTERDCPVEVLTALATPLTNIIAIAGSTLAGMALSSNGTIYTWGYNSGGMLGNGTTIGSDCLYAKAMTGGYCSLVCSLTSVTASATKDTICMGDSAIISATAIGSSTVTYSWSPGGQTTQTIHITPASTATYTVTVNDTVGGCSKTDSITVKVDSLPTVSLTIAKDTPCVSMTTDALTGSPSGGTYSGTGVTGSNFNPNSAGVGSYTLQYTYTDGNGCINMDSLNIIVSSCTGINELQTTSEDVRVYPNAFSQNINVTVNMQGTVIITIFNAMGQNVGTWQMNKGKHIINTRNFPAGIYMMRVKTANGLLNKKLVKVN